MPTEVKIVSRKENWTSSGLQVTTILDVYPYSGRVEVLQRLLGTYALIAGRIVRTPPAQDPWYPYCFCTSAEVDGDEEGYIFGGGNGGVRDLYTRAYYGKFARITATYSTFDVEAAAITGGAGNTTNEQEEKELASLAWDFSGRVVPIPQTYYGYQPDGIGTPITRVLLDPNATGDYRATRTVPQMGFTIARHYVTKKPNLAILALMGRVNGSQWTIRNEVYPAETLRFDCAGSTQKLTNQGINFFEMQYKFEIIGVRDKIENDTVTWVGWNREFNHITSRWERIAQKGDLLRSKFLLDYGNPGSSGADLDVKQTLGGREVHGFDLLFHPQSS